MHGREYRIFKPEGSGSTGPDQPDLPDCTNCTNDVIRRCAADGITEGQRGCAAWTARRNARRPGQN